MTHGFASALPARSASLISSGPRFRGTPLPRRCLHGVHRFCRSLRRSTLRFASALPARSASAMADIKAAYEAALPRRCLHGVHLGRNTAGATLTFAFASALPARSASEESNAGVAVISSLPRRCLHGVHPKTGNRTSYPTALPRRCLHGVHRQKSPNRGTPFCSIRRESVDSFSEISNKDSCADYFPALFCCQGDLHHHYRQPRTGNRPVLRCEQHRLFLFILSSHYRRLL